MTNIHAHLLDACRAATELSVISYNHGYESAMRCRSNARDPDRIRSINTQLDAAISAAEELKRPVDEDWLRSIPDFAGITVERINVRWWAKFDGVRVELKSKLQLLALLHGLGADVAVATGDREGVSGG